MSRRINWTDDVMLRAIELRNAGRTWPEVRDEVAPGVRTAPLAEAVRRYCRARGGGLLTREPRRQHAWTTRDLRTVADARRAGRTWRECGELVGVSAQAAQAALRWAGVAVEPEEVAPSEHPRQDLVRRAVAERNGTGDSWAVLAARIGWPRTLPALQSACAAYCRRQELTLKPGRFGRRARGGQNG